MQPILTIAVIVILAKYAIELLIDLRQYFKYKQIERPQQLPQQISQEDFSKSQKYNTEILFLSIIENTIDLVIQISFLLSGLLSYAWQKSCEFAQNWSFISSQNDIPRAWIFSLILMIQSDVQGILFSYYKTFYIQVKYKFNKTTKSLFFTDFVKSLILKFIITGLMISGILYIIIQGGDQFIFYLFFFVLGMIFFFMTIFPNVIQPLFNKFEQLKQGELRQRIYKLAKSLQFPLTKIYICDASKRSSHSNAYLYGMWWNKRIVLFDTLLQQSSDDEIVAVLAHELGHWYKGHTMQGIAMTMIHMLFFFLAFQKIMNNSKILTDFGFKTVMSDGKPSAVLGLLVFSHFYSPFSFIWQILFNFCSRRFEYQADTFAKKQGYTEKLISGLINLFIKNAGNLNPDSWYSTVNNSHPTLVERISAMRRVDDIKLE